MDEETHPPEQPGAARVVCARCGTAADGETAPPTWICSVENGRRHYLCDDCARTHIRSIESRLDSAWW
ncbi:MULTISPECIES: hypothetical protein [unclassified Streptomyces]|uniref:hypothetical protein n=1 Tax=unclassified Streptomyces TaxID=2593676 RepID=UPI00093C23DD|nr:hypothetical protein [Streptomyces sp. TSRI0281]OKI47671.1 hypothetical protein A6A29_00840 [Streptomyces sp. TSRI0281]